MRAIGLPPLLGYLLAGVLIGPFTPGIVANQAMAGELAEVGVALLLFNIGMHFSFKDLLAVRRVAVPGAIMQVIATTIGGAIISYNVLTISVSASIVIGLSLSIASTAVATRLLDERHQLTALPGRIAMGWLIVQDIIVIVALVLFPALGGFGQESNTRIAVSLGQTILQVTGFVAVMIIGGRRMIPALLAYVARKGSRELFTLAVIVIALGIAYGSATIFGVSLALGAFFAGIVIGESDMNHHAASEALSMQQVFTILFFVSVGMLFDPSSILTMPRQILWLLLTVIVGTGVLSFVILLSMNVPLQAAALVGAAFAQIGEFSFVLSELGFKNGFYGAAERDLIMAVALVSIVVNPLVLALTTRAARWAAALPLIADWNNRHLESAPENLPIGDHAILVGHGRVGSVVAAAMRENSIPYIAIESDRVLVEKLRTDGVRVIYGDASRENVLIAAAPSRAKILIVAVPDTYYARQIIRLARKISPTLDIVVRTHSDEETKSLSRLGVGMAIMGEREIGFGMAFYALQKAGIDGEQTRNTISQMRKRIYGLDLGHTSDQL